MCCTIACLDVDNRTLLSSNINICSQWRKPSGSHHSITRLIKSLTSSTANMRWVILASPRVSLSSPSHLSHSRFPGTSTAMNAAAVTRPHPSLTFEKSLNVIMSVFFRSAISVTKKRVTKCSRHARFLCALTSSRYCLNQWFSLSQHRAMQLGEWVHNTDSRKVIRITPVPFLQDGEQFYSPPKFKIYTW